ncbi:MAG: polyprenol monophosphomannose synthase [Lentisphaeria bacterium]|nr:polyprenol monophosphomannose synthase [Lentisphaeria bacterium]
MHTTVVVPTFNERDNIPSLVKDVFKALPDCQLLVVDDNSPDGTGEVVALMSERNPAIQLLRRDRKRGLGPAYLDGFRKVLDQGAKTVIQMDADFSHSPHVLPTMIETLESGSDLVIGSRYVNGGSSENWGWHRQLISTLGSRYACRVLGLNLRDVTGGFKCWRGDLLRDILPEKFLMRGFGFQVELNHRAALKNARISEVPIVFTNRLQGKSKMTPWIMIEALIGMLRLRRKLGRANGCPPA